MCQAHSGYLYVFAVPTCSTYSITSRARSHVLDVGFPAMIEVSRDGSLGAGCSRQGIPTSTVTPPMQDDFMALLDQQPGRHKTEAVR